MRLTKSQTELLHLALSAPKRGLSFSVVHVQRGSGLTTVLKEIQRRGAQAESKPLVIYGGGGWEAVCDLSDRTGTVGMGYALRIRRAMEYLTRNGKQPVTLLLSHAEVLSHEGQCRFFAALEHVCDECGFDVRCVLLAHRVYAWNAREAKRQGQDAVFVGWIYDRCTHAFRFSREGLDAVGQAEETPLLERATA